MLKALLVISKIKFKKKGPGEVRLKNRAKNLTRIDLTMP